MPQSVGVLSICVTVYFVLTAFASPVDWSAKEPLTNLDLALDNQNRNSTTMDFLSITITPPSYTGLKSFVSSSPDLKMPEGSEATWSIKFSSEMEQPQILFSNKDSIKLIQTKEGYSQLAILKESGFYQIQWKHDQKLVRSDYFKIEIIKDELPKVAIDNLNQFTQFSLTDLLKVKVQATLQDDYGLTGSTIVATVSKGSGESVKFREEKLRFETPKTIAGKKVNASVSLDLLKLGMEAGDELYFYVETLDNKVPTPNYNRTETFFVAIKDTVKQVAVEDEGLGVDLMPEYFRSQRQIIIDTEKLLREKKRIALQQFKSTSNELGYDQKVLRLRYGQFLGEEFEGQIGKASVQEDIDDHESTIEKFGHAHDKENEHNLVSDKKAEPTAHQHADELKDPDAKENPLEAFAHNHDDGEEATFFVQSVRAKLKAALTVMWDAELYLRLYEPEKSLPYQYTALKLLKEISNDSRIYVHRTGFDPPPLKEEKRLTGDLNEVRNSSAQTEQSSKALFPEIRKALVLLDDLIDQDVSTLSQKDKNQLRLAGQELASVIMETPGKFLEGLTLLKKIEDTEMNKSDIQLSLRSIQKIFWKILPLQSVSPTKANASVHELDQQFLKNLMEIKHD
ncbi:MAG: tryptophan-rich sensory protein [Cyclobacteriaceae bacterium]|nr:tryptophan-rich sensory protein [Cyclobacteriaceae bacterium]